MTRAKKWALLPGVFMIGAVLAESAPAQERQRQQGQQRERQQALSSRLEDLIVISLAERSNLVNVIKVTVKEGVAALSGKIPSEQAERRALRIARTTPGIMSVRDEISVDASIVRRSTTPVSEAELAQQVAQKIAANVAGAKAGKDWWFGGWRVEGEFNTWNLIVEVDDPGRVLLDGEVPNLEIMRKALEGAFAVPGVLALHSNLELEQRYAYGYPHYGYRGFYGPYAHYGLHPFAPYAWHPPAAAAEPTAQNERQSQAR